MDSLKAIVLEKATEEVLNLLIGKSCSELKEILKKNKKQQILLRCFERFCESEIYKNEFGGTGCEIDKKVILNVSDEKISPALDEAVLIKNLDDVFKKCILVDDIDEFKRIAECICNSYRDEAKKMLELFHIFEELQKGNIANNQVRNEFRKYFEIVLENQRNIEETVKSTVGEIKQILGNSLNTNENDKSDTIIESSEYNLALEYVKTNDFEDAISILRKLNSACSDGIEKKKISFQIGYCYLKWSVTKEGNKKKIEHAIYYLEKSIQHISAYPEDEDFLIYKNLSRAYEEAAKYKNPKDNFENAEKYICLALNLAKGLEDNQTELIAHQLDLARIYEKFCEFCAINKVKEYLVKSIIIYKSIIDSEDNLSEEAAFILFHNIGRVYEKKAELEANYEDFDNALQYYLEAEKVPYASVYNNPLQFALLHNNLGNIYFKKDTVSIQDEEELLNEALRHYRLAVDVYNCDEYRYDFMKTSTNMGRVFRLRYKKYKRENDFLECEKILEDVLIYRTPIIDPTGYAYVKIELAQLYMQKVKIECIFDIIDNEDVKEKKSYYALKYLSDAKALCKDGLSILKKDSNEKLYCSALYIYGKVLAIQGRFTEHYVDFENALNKCKEVLLLCKVSNNSHMFQVVIRETVDIMCNMFDYIGNIEERYKWYLEQLNYLQRINAEKYSFPIYYNISMILYEKYNEGDDIEHLNDALIYLRECKSVLGEESFESHTNNLFDDLWQRIENAIEQYSN